MPFPGGLCLWSKLRAVRAVHNRCGLDLQGQCRRAPDPDDIGLRRRPPGDMTGPDVRQGQRGHASHREHVQCPVRQLRPLEQHRLMVSRGYPANYHSRHSAADLDLGALRQVHDPVGGRTCPQHKNAAASRTLAGELDALVVSHVRTEYCSLAGRAEQARRCLYRSIRIYSRLMRSCNSLSKSCIPANRRTARINCAILEEESVLPYQEGMR
jgi:hypothetical protein